MKTSDAFFPIVEELLRRGEINKARLALSDVNADALSRNSRLPFAALARRAQLPDLALRVLAPYVRGTTRKPADANAKEIAEYAEALTKSGLAEEAISRLKKIDVSEAPEACLYLVSALASRWDYVATIEPLQKYLKLSKDPYLSIVAELNLASAFVVEKNEKAESLLNLLRKKTSQKKWQRLYGNTLELSAGFCVLNEKWKDAEGFLKEAERALGKSAGFESFFIKKWRAIMALRRDGANATTLAELEKVQTEAKSRQHWETLRDCDRYRAIATRKAEDIARVFHGTPYASFRASFAKELQGSEIPPSYAWSLQGKRPPMLALEDGKLEEKTILAPGSKPLLLLSALCADLYRPARIGGLFARLFVDELFNPLSSPNRVHQSVRRLRSALEEKACTLSVVEKDGVYHLEAETAFGIRVSQVPLGKHDAHLSNLRKHWPKGTFTIAEASRLMDVHVRVLQRVLHDAEEKKLVQHEGAGASRKYRFR